MKATVTKAFPGAADNDPQTRVWQPGETVEGALAKVAVDEGWADEINDAPVEGAGVQVSPAARKVAEEHGIDLETVTGSGKAGWITKADVEAAIA